MPGTTRPSDEDRVADRSPSTPAARRPAWSSGTAFPRGILPSPTRARERASLRASEPSGTVLGSLVHRPRAGLVAHRQGAPMSERVPHLAGGHYANLHLEHTFDILSPCWTCSTGFGR